MIVGRFSRADHVPQTRPAMRLRRLSLLLALAPLLPLPVACSGDDAGDPSTPVPAVAPARDADVFNNRGVDLARAGRTEEAIRMFERALALEPDSALAQRNYGMALMEAGRVDESDQAFRRAIELDPNDAMTHRNAGLMLFYRGDVRGAILATDRSLKINPNSAEAWTNMGRFMGELGRLDEALSAFERALEVDPSFAPAREGARLTRQDIEVRDAAAQEGDAESPAPEGADDDGSMADDEPAEESTDEDGGNR
jgi:tetratricopeptide (TPR) repeat protein